MTYKQIVFSVKFKKLKALGNINLARLLEVVEVNFNDLSLDFLNFDTDNGKFPLPKQGQYLLLIFNAQNGVFFTLRRSNKEKKDYYKKARGEVFKIIYPRND